MSWELQDKGLVVEGSIPFDKEQVKKSIKKFKDSHGNLRNHVCGDLPNHLLEQASETKPFLLHYWIKRLSKWLESGDRSSAAAKNVFECFFWNCPEVALIGR